MQQSQAKSLFVFESGLDNEILYELYECDYESAHQAFQIFLDELETNISALQDAHQQKNISSFQKTVHRCKPVFSYVGLSHLNTIFQSLEDQCNSVDDLDKLDPSFNEVINKIRVASPVIEKEMNRLSNFIKKRA
jgi:HPt (histidine-containing phosphotransfer) domain-containing protein